MKQARGQRKARSGNRHVTANREARGFWEQAVEGPADFAAAAPPEEIRGITWDLWGVELSHVQTVQRIVKAGFPVAGGVALTMFAIVEGESGEYQRAWHINVARNPDGTVKRIETPTGTAMEAKSIDLGLMQFNVVQPTLLPMTEEAVTKWVERMFEANPDLADPQRSAERAYELWKRRGFQPWYAWQPGTERFRLKKRYGALALAQWVVNSFVGKDPETGKVPQVQYKK